MALSTKRQALRIKKGGGDRETHGIYLQSVQRLNKMRLITYTIKQLKMREIILSENSAIVTVPEMLCLEISVMMLVNKYH